MGHNMLTGTIPESYGKAPKLGQLALGYNRFTGTLPSNLGWNGWMRCDSSMPQCFLPTVVMAPAQVP